MRWVAKNVVAAGLAKRCEVQVAYAIGKAHPVGFYVETFGTEVVPVSQIQQAVLEVFDLRPAAIIHDLDLKRPIYAQTAAYGHFGRELPGVTWEPRTGPPPWPTPSGLSSHARPAASTSARGLGSACRSRALIRKWPRCR